MSFPTALTIALLVAEVAAVVLAVRARVGRPLVLLLGFALVDELAVLAIHVLLAGTPRPIAGWWRVPYHAENAFSLGWPCLLAAVCWGRPWRRLDVLAGAYLGALAGLVVVYPTDAPGSGAPRLRWALLAWEVLMVAAAWAGLYRARLRPWGAVERCLVILAACETMVALVGPFASDPFTRWWVGACFYLAAWGGVGVVFSRRAAASSPS